MIDLRSLINLSHWTYVNLKNNCNVLVTKNLDYNKVIESNNWKDVFGVSHTAAKCTVTTSRSIIYSSTYNTYSMEVSCNIAKYTGDSKEVNYLTVEYRDIHYGRNLQ